MSLTDTIQQILNTSQFNAEIITAIILFAITTVAGAAVYVVFTRYFSKWAEKTETTLDDDIIAAVQSFIVILVIIIGLEFALSPLSFLQPYQDTMQAAFLVVEILLIAFAITRVLNIFADWYSERGSKQGKNRRHQVFILKKLIQIFVFIGAFFIILWSNNVFNGDNLSNIALTAGAGSIALAFALQSTLTDFFSAFSIYYDRPFEIGDFITVGNYSGTVTNIGMKSTRLKLLSGEELVLSNKELNNASVQNFRKLEKRRVVFSIGVAYDTPTEKLEKIPLILRGIIENTEHAEIERVHFTEFGDFALKFLVSYYVKVADYGVYLDTQQSINFAIKKAFDQEGIEMAFPTSTVYLKSEQPKNFPYAEVPTFRKAVE